MDLPLPEDRLQINKRNEIENLNVPLHIYV